MVSLEELLIEEGFQHHRKTNIQKAKPGQEPLKLEHKESSLLILHHHERENSLSNPEENTAKTKNFDGGESGANQSWFSKENQKLGLALDDTTVTAVISILRGYISRFSEDKSFRNTIKKRCSYCLRSTQGIKENQNNLETETFMNLKLGMRGIERLMIEFSGNKQESRIISLQNSINLLKLIISLSSPELRHGFTCGIPNSHLLACANLYLSIVYNLQRNHRISAKHLLQVFCDSPLQARAYLLPDLWERLFLSHLRPLEAWYSEEAESLRHFLEREGKMRVVNRVFNEEMDLGTCEIALYYKQWLQIDPRTPKSLQLFQQHPKHLSSHLYPF